MYVRSTDTASLARWLAVSREDRRALVQACLDRIREVDASIHAWVDVQPQPIQCDGPLAGIPFGAKDIIETRGLATEWGSPIYKGRIGTGNAAIVRDLQDRGAVLLGKTQTTAFAYRTPAPTRNPHDVEHTPGGSSSGSAAAVAAGMVPFALGTQTQGSVIRPASFCGIAGFKPTYGVVPMEGVLPFAPSFDTLGFFTASAGDMLALWEAMGYVGFPTARPVGRVLSDPAAIVFGVTDPPLPDVDSSMAAALERTIDRLRDRGARVEPIDMREMLVALNDASRVVMAYEAARVHEQRYREHGDRMADMAVLVRQGMDTPAARYDETRRVIETCREQAVALFERTPIILSPAAVGPAPFSLASTGDPRMNAPWTALGVPAMTIPMGEAGGLPLGLQLVADRGEDLRVLHAAMHLESVLQNPT